VELRLYNVRAYLNRSDYSEGPITDRSLKQEIKTVVFLDINIQFVPHRRHITSPLECQAGKCYVRSEGFHGGDYVQCRLLGCDAVWLL
jgi:hypothetical protein